MGDSIGCAHPSTSGSARLPGGARECGRFTRSTALSSSRRRHLPPSAQSNHPQSSASSATYTARHHQLCALFSPVTVSFTLIQSVGPRLSDRSSVASILHGSVPSRRRRRRGARGGCAARRRRDRGRRSSQRWRQEDGVRRRGAPGMPTRLYLQLLSDCRCMFYALYYWG
jgi:hypothetical protein